jgi:hypothetical protein
VSLDERYLSHSGHRRAGAPADDPDRSGCAGRRDSHSRETGEPATASVFRRHRARALSASVHPGDVVEIEAIVVRLRSRMGLLKGVARVDGKTVIDGTMTFALSPPQPVSP